MSIHISLSSVRPNFMHPYILQHPQIPAPISGINPRSVLGQSWWDDTRRDAYSANNYFCHACGGSPDDDPFSDYLEAHECYDIDWKECLASYSGTVALCTTCHNFIHAGRMQALVDEGKRPPDRLVAVLKYGESVLWQQRLRPYWRTYVIARIWLDGMTEHEAIVKAREVCVMDLYDIMRLDYSKWRVLIQGKRYRRNQNGAIVSD